MHHYEFFEIITFILSLSLANKIIQTIVTRLELKRKIYKETNQWCNIISKSLLMTFKITLERLWFHLRPYNS